MEMNKYDKEFEIIFNQTALFSKMWELFDTHPEDKKEIYEAFSKQDDVLLDIELNDSGNWLTEY